MKMFCHRKIEKIVYYGDIEEDLFDRIKIQIRKKNFNECEKRSKVLGKFKRISEDFYIFNKKYNSCWGKKIAITKDGKIRPCIYSEIIIGDINKDDIEDIMKKAKKYWNITKDKVKICKDCELRYVCFDCREIAQRKNNGNLYATNPLCTYNPYTGKWD